MVTDDVNALLTVMVMIKNQKRYIGNFQCPICGMEGLTEYGLNSHLHLYHSSEPNSEGICTICNK